ncbi:unnamed protein product [Adineta ricciae]|uniref:Uncharacterized protein n=1 Tax=Adineta ricciae TaxID=249248 RepID=A0A815W5Q5_ADIRI|nr:unnamed protein product [Adineta ricciae]
MVALKVFVYLLLLCCKRAELVSTANENIRNTDDCTYEDARFGRIDLSEVGLKDGVPAFRNLEKGDYFYSYNPCYSFTEKPLCNDVAACQIYKDGSISFPLGYNSFATWSISETGNASLIYSIDVM